MPEACPKQKPTSVGVRFSYQFKWMFGHCFLNEGGHQKTNTVSLRYISRTISNFQVISQD